MTLKLSWGIHCILEEKQKNTLAEWCSAQENAHKLASRRHKSVPRANEEYKWLDDGGDTVFNQLVSFSFCWKRLYTCIVLLAVSNLFYKDSAVEFLRILMCFKDYFIRINCSS